MYQLENYENQKKIVQPVKPKKQKYHGWQKFLAIVLIFVVCAAVVANAVVDAINHYNLNMEYVNTLIGYLNEPVAVEQLVTTPLEQETAYMSFVEKANLSGLDVFQDDAVTVSIDADTIALNTDIVLTDQEIGAFINQLFYQGEEGFMTLLQVVIDEQPAGFTLSVVAQLSFTSVLEDFQDLMSDFPANIYISSVSNMVVSNEVLVIGGTQVQINQLDSDKNEEVIDFLDSLFQTSEENYTISQLISLIVSETMNDLALKTNSVPLLGDGQITLILNEEE